MKKILSSLITIAVVAAVAVGASSAFFTDTDTSSTNSFTSGSFEIEVNENGTTDTFDLDFGTLALSPGDETLPVSVEIMNSGTVNAGWVGYFDLSGITNNLDEAVYIKEMQMEFLDDNGGGDWEPLDDFITNGTGSGLYGAYFTALASGDTFGVLSLRKWNSVSNNLMGTGDGVFAGAFKPGFRYKLTFTLAMADAAGDAYQGGTMDLVYKVLSTQVNADALSALDAGDPRVSIAAPVAIKDWMDLQLAKQIP